MTTPNPFRPKAIAARERADRLNRPTSHERGMADAFPLGAGFGRGSASSRAQSIDSSVSRAVDAVEAERDARYLEAQAEAFDRGEINAQGRSMSAAMLKRRAKAASEAAR